MTSAESHRQIVHMGVVVLAFLLRFLSAPWALFLAFFLLVHNVLLLPRYAPSLFRPDERGVGGIHLYPLALCALILLFPQRMEVVAGAWALLAIGDGLATLVGRLRPIAPLPWNPEKSVGGLLAFVVGGTLACSILVVWTVPTAGQSAWILLTCGVCALLAGLSESLLLPINDNLLVPMVAAPCLSFLLAANISPATWTLTAGTLLFALFMSAVLAAVAYRLRLVGMNGALGGAVIGTLVYILGGPAAFVLFVLFLVLESGIAWSGFAGKTAEPVTRESGSQCGGKDALAHCGFALLLTFLWAMTDGVDPLLKLMYVSALAAAFADRVAGEFGAMVSRSSFPPLRIENVPLGTEGAIPLEGSLLGICAAVIFAGCGSIVGLCVGSLLPAVIIGTTIAVWVKSVMVATAGERDVILDDKWLNCMNVFAGALSAAIVAYLLAGGALYS